MADAMSSRIRWAGWIALAAALGILAAVLLDRRAPLAPRVLARAPEGASIVAYAELAGLRRSEVLGRMLRQRLLTTAGFSLVEPDVDAVAIVVASDEIVGLAAGRFSLSLVRRYLEQNGATCPAALDEQACSVPSGRGGSYLSIRAFEGGVIGVTNGPRTDAADRLKARVRDGERLAGEARAALDSGALVWVSIDPRRLADTMSDPPEGWINLSLVARALIAADKASLDLRDQEGREAVQATLQAVCASENDAAELSRMLESLNKLAAAALRSGNAEENQAWARALSDEFSTESRGTSVTARWSIPATLLGKTFGGESR